jgi:hypothetical protein
MKNKILKFEGRSVVFAIKSILYRCSVYNQARKAFQSVLDGSTAAQIPYQKSIAFYNIEPCIKQKEASLGQR